ncbi:MAG: class A beta-lactamase-related serine hydrolase [Defluviitaleaceae bacterium]|nr:class A beta-lactamase-related serine hydrolase [Defluviitaleaceae bacterium]
MKKKIMIAAYTTATIIIGALMFFLGRLTAEAVPAYIEVTLAPVSIATPSPSPAPTPSPTPASTPNPQPTLYNPISMHTEKTPPTDDLDALIKQHGYNLAVFYKNLETGFTYTHNAYRIFFGASLTKANHALYVYTLAERGMIDLYTVHTFTSSDIRGGTGIIRNMPIGTPFTTRELLQHSIIHSCNVAFGMLVRHTTYSEFSYNDFLYDLGASNFGGNIANHLNANATDTALWMYVIHNYIEAESQFGHYFREDLMRTPGFIISSYPMARKYGWAIASFHDAAVVYASSPYILVIMSDMDGGAAELFANISWQIQQFNDMWFDNTNPIITKPALYPATYPYP